MLNYIHQEIGGVNMDVQLKVYILDNGTDCVETIGNVLARDERFILDGVTSDTEQALAHIKENKPDVLLLEPVLGDKDGFAFMENIMLNCADDAPEVILISAFMNNAMKGRAAELGAYYYLKKPIIPDMLYDRLRELMDEKIKMMDSAKENSIRVRNIERKVTEMLHEVGVPAHVKGYRYVRSAIVMAVLDNSVINAITKVLYPSVAKEFNTTASRVERSIRHAIELAWDRGDVDVLQGIFGFTVSYSKGKPTNSEFIAMLADRMYLQMENIM